MLIAARRSGTIEKLGGETNEPPPTAQPLLGLGGIIGALELVSRYFEKHDLQSIVGKHVTDKS